jgi:putative endonuclease
MRRPSSHPAPALDTAGASATARGAAAESVAADFLTGRGLVVLARNIRCKGGEIDLVCRDGTVLVLVEVRQRSRADFGGALASVNTAKRRRIVRTARYVLQRCSAWCNGHVRFDVVGVQGRERGGAAIEWIKDAFRAAI